MRTPKTTAGDCGLSDRSVTQETAPRHADAAKTSPALMGMKTIPPPTASTILIHRRQEAQANAEAKLPCPFRQLLQGVPTDAQDSDAVLPLHDAIATDFRRSARMVLVHHLRRSQKVMSRRSALGLAQVTRNDDDNRPPESGGASMTGYPKRFGSATAILSGKRFDRNGQ